MLKGFTSSQKSDRHRAGTVTLSIRVPAALRANFASYCHGQGLSSSDVLRNLMSAFLKAAKND